ncbi:unnamed protein product [Didymodactylos carnosus]|uniref:GP-PDE domain-containing protein n=1 Tax=Didymodactylos carnosus TaxID=1234261 RepID=A0A816B892_9BILA|nr:unnamed protein product [Didymodactylos carnosus]CAF1608005.1 unnamed protein product [Didymodactylos carnosus]CAF4230520.1 unnamed protein product [Didymodactylos carnosus]CAF4488981.1 unnamed protein product [Didymodactylos carnosus]
MLQQDTITSQAINIGTFFLLLSPLFLVLKPIIVVSFIVLPPISLWILYNYLRLPCAQGHLKFDNIIIAHRGGRPLLLDSVIDDSDFPENTLAAYKWASKCQGAQAIELDVWLSKDHVAVVVHDSHLADTLISCQGRSKTVESRITRRSVRERLPMLVKILI